MSGELVEKMNRRARTFLQIADELIRSRDYDVAVFALEQAVQLRIKALLLRLFGEYQRTHGVRELLGMLSARLEEAGFSELAERVRMFVADNRGYLWVLEEAYTMARYGARSYGEVEAKNLREIVLKLWELLEEVEKSVVSEAHG